MEVSAGGNWGWQDNTSGIEGLIDALEVTTAGDLLDEDWCEALRTELLVDAEKVDLGRLQRLLADTERDWDTGDECDELLGGDGADTNVPVCLPSRREESPMHYVSQSFA